MSFLGSDMGAAVGLVCVEVTMLVVGGKRCDGEFVRLAVRSPSLR